MPPKKNWQPDLTLAAQSRLQVARDRRQQSETAWRSAVTLLQASQKEIKFGKQHGVEILKGLPDKIQEAIKQVLIRIAREEEPVLLPETVGADLLDRVTSSRNYRNIKYGDSKYCLLAALYKHYQGVRGFWMDTNYLKNSANKHTLEGQIDFNENFLRTGRVGAWKAKDTLRSEHLIIEEKRAGNNNKYYCLSLDGAKLCYAMFTDPAGNFHYSKISAPEVKPIGGRVDQDGNFFADRGTEELPRNYHASSSFLPLSSSSSSSSSFSDKGFSMGVAQSLSSPVMKNCPTFDDTRSPSSSHPSESIEAVRRKRIIKMNPALAVKVQEMMKDIGITEEEAWMLVHQGAMDKQRSVNDTAEETEIIEHLFTNNLCANITEAKEILRIPDVYDQMKSVVSSTKKDDRTLKMQYCKKPNSPAYLRFEDDFEPRHTTVPVINYSHDDSQESVEIIEDYISDEHKCDATSPKRKKVKVDESMFLDLTVEKSYSDCQLNLLDSPPKPFRSYDGAEVFNDMDDEDEFHPNIKDNLTSVTILKNMRNKMKLGDLKLQHAAAHSALKFIICKNERASNSHYQEFSQMCKLKIKNACPDMCSSVQHMPLGDFMWTVEAHHEVDDEEEEANESSLTSLFTGVVIERKGLSDIVGSSADVNKSISSRVHSLEEARHFKQERQLRYSQAAFPMFLLEGEFWTASNMNARVSSHAGDKDLMRPDAMADQDKKSDFMTLMCSIICRNFGSNVVSILLTPSASSSALLFAAISAVLESKIASSKYISLQSYLFHTKMIKSKRDRFLNLLGTLSEDTMLSASVNVVDIVSRRFSDYESLLSAYTSCATDLHASMLTSDLSAGGTNRDCPSNFDLSRETLSSLKAFSESLWKDVITTEHLSGNAAGNATFSHTLRPLYLSSPLPTDMLPQNRITNVIVYNASTSLIGDDKYPDKLKIFSQTDKDSRFSWASIVTSIEDTRHSAPMTVLVLSGVQILELWAEAFELLETSTPAEVDVIRTAFFLLESQFSPILMDNIADVRSRAGQVILLIDNIGTGANNRGAFSKLVKLCSEYNESSTQVPLLSLSSDGFPFSIDTARYLSQRDTFLLYVHTAVAILEQGLQVIPTSGGAELGDYFAVLLHEHNRVSLLTH